MAQTDPIYSRKKHSNSIDSSKFYEWSKQFQYKSSATSLNSDKLNPIRCDVIQGYQGFVPQIQANSLPGQTFCKNARQILSSNLLGSNPFKLSSNGLNVSRHNFADQSLHAVTHKYGSQTIQQNHPSIQSDFKESIYKTSFKKHKYNNEDGFNIDEEFVKGTSSDPYPTKTLLSGFIKNNNISVLSFQKLQNERSQSTGKINTLIETEYKNQFPEQNFHRDTRVLHLRNRSLKTIV